MLAAALLFVFVLSWAGLIWAVGYGLWNIFPALKTKTPSAVLAALLLVPQLLFLIQGLFYLPPKEIRSPVFLDYQYFKFPLAFLLFPRRPVLKPGPAFRAVAGPEDQKVLLERAAARGRVTLVPYLAFLLESRGPLDYPLSRLAAGSGAALAFKFLYLLASPARQFARFWGFLFFIYARKYADPGPVDDFSRYKRAVAYDLFYRAQELPLDPASVEDLIDLRQSLALVFNDPAYGKGQGGEMPGGLEAGAAQIYSAPHLAPRYRGAYLDLPVTLAARTPGELYDRGGMDSPEIFYPPELGEEMELQAGLSAENERLTELLAGRDREGYLLIDGRPLLSWELEREIVEVAAGLLRLRQRQAAHNRRCRSSHLAAARKIGRGWPELLINLTRLLYLIEQARRDLSLAIDDFRNKAGEPDDQSFEMLIRALAERLAGLNLPPELGFSLENPESILHLEDDENLERRDREASSLAICLGQLRDKVLAALLAAESRLDQQYRQPQPEEAPYTLALEDDQLPWTSAPPVEEEPMARPNQAYSVAERLRADWGRGLLAAAVLSLIIWQSTTLGHSRIYVYNGLGRQIEAELDGRRLSLAPYGFESLELRPDQNITVVSRAGHLVVESFNQTLAPRPGKEVYNVAAAAPLLEWVSPRSAYPAAELFLGRPRWLGTKAEILFLSPPDRDNGWPKLVLSAYGQASPGEILAAFDDDKDRRELIALHARWDSPASPWYFTWQVLQSGRPDLALGIFTGLPVLDND